MGANQGRSIPVEGVHRLAAQLGIGDLEKFLRAILANVEVAKGARLVTDLPTVRRYTIAEVAAELGVSQRWLADQCRSERVEHLFVARRRFFTEEQLARLIASFSVVPVGRLDPKEIQREKVKRRLEASSNRRRSSR